jgi:hypothetical protein
LRPKEKKRLERSEEEKGGKKPRSVLLLPSINSTPFLPPYIGGIDARKRGRSTKDFRRLFRIHIFPERVLG